MPSRFLLELKNNNIETLQQPKIDHDLFTVFGQNYEAEIWLKPCDAFSWDLQMVERIQKYIDDVFVLSVEDYILTKLARADRSSTDINDILQILINNLNEINWKYLRFRLQWIDLIDDFKDILKAFEIDVKEEYKLKGRKITEKLEVGVAGINTHGGGPLGTPWGGTKESGIGRLGCKEGFRAFTNTKLIRWS